MPSSFSLFNKGAFSQTALVYENDFKDRAAALESGEPIYEVFTKWRKVGLQQTTADGPKALLLGNYEGFLKRSVSLSGYGSSTAAKRTGVLKLGWSFVDFMSNEFTWRVSGWKTSWTLSDVNGAVVAKFTRTKLHRNKLGILEIFEDVPESLQSLIIVSYKLVHKSVQDGERSS
ncbi:hypothetical protein GGI21_002403 [Coemansia aciculifera]|uniref:Uncharacterized protein n=1 Tax=Coemansia aciculifera TaxID=417176 RepID=A0ACC1M838_9FUNG|nr:hypothetical protein IWW38_001447 [Coemansia aciculifera]KAJ2908918.1 hypothetical protein GGI21_002403 [Coemansia aciculifera]